MTPLKAILAKIDEVDEKYRDLYTEQGGKWILTGVEGIKTQKDIDALQLAAKKEREDHAATKLLLKTANEKVTAWEDLNPEEVKAKLEKLETLEAGNSVPELAKNFETTVQQRVKDVLDGKVRSETVKLQRTIDELKGKLGEAEGQITGFVSQNNTRTVHDAVRAAAVASKVLPEAVADLLLVAGSELKLDESGKVITADGRDPATWLEDRKAKTPYLWPQARGTGSGNGHDDPSLGAFSGKNNPFSRDGWNMTKAAQLVASNPAQADKLAEVAGVPKGPDGKFQYHVMPAKAA